MNNGEKLSFNSFFNSFFEYSYAKYTMLKNVYLILNCEGDFEISLIREDKNIKEEIKKNVIKGSRKNENIKILMPEIDINRAGRIYAELRCLSKCGKFYEGFFATDDVPAHEVSLAIILPTYKREKQVKKLIEVILSDKGLYQMNWDLYLIDNAKTLSSKELSDPKINIFWNKNTGGSGGYTRGLIEAGKKKKYTHFLFLEDDVALDTESIFCLINVYKYASKDFQIFGISVDDYAERVNKNVKDRKTLLSSFTEESILKLITYNEIDFDSTPFYFLSFSKATLDKVGFPFPYFILNDDTDYGQRIIKETGHKFVIFNPISSWHDYCETGVNSKTFDKWRNYYYARGLFIFNSVHQKKMKIANILKKVIVSFLMGNPQNIFYIAKGLEDYLKGPAILKENDPEKRHEELRFIYSKIPISDMGGDRFLRSETKEKILFIFKILTNMFSKKGVYGIIGSIKFTKNLIAYMFLKKSVNKLWEMKYKEIITEKFWTEYLGLNKII